jgi:hypothetical protein
MLLTLFARHAKSKTRRGMTRRAKHTQSPTYAANTIALPSTYYFYVFVMATNGNSSIIASIQAIPLPHQRRKSFQYTGFAHQH